MVEAGMHVVKIALYLNYVFVYGATTQTFLVGNITAHESYIIENARHLCLDESVCHGHLERGQLDTTCCKSCSCSPDCASFNRCCFLNGSQIPPPFAQCQYTRSKAVESWRPELLRSYYMVDVCPETFRGRAQDEAECGEQKVAPWGSLFPVHSDETGIIYRNKECAKCHNVTDVKGWDVVVTCSVQLRFPYIYLGLNSHLDILGENELPTQCHVDTIPPTGANWSDFSKLKCFDIDLIDRCSFQSFKIPPGLAMTQEEIVNACESGFWSPFLLGMRARNVFCRICNRYILRDRNPCYAEPPDDILTNDDQLTFSMLLNVPVILNSADGVKDAASMACKMNNSTDCRVSQCPSGQLRLRKNVCALSAGKWSKTMFQLNVKLVPTDGLTFLGAKQAVNDNGGSVVRTPLPKFWKLKHILFQTESEFENGSIQFGNIVLKYQYQGAVNNVTRFLALVERSFENKWMFMTKSKQYEMKAKFWEFSHIEIIGDKVIPESLLDIAPRYPSMVSSHYFLNRSIHVLFGNRYFERGFVINRLNFCMQVDLVEHEFTDLGATVYHNQSDQYFFDSQYAKSYTMNGEVRVKVCMDELGYQTNAMVISRASFLHINGFAAISVSVFMSPFGL